ncbi:MAG: hybrid sensor histidine kinase/response regulator [Anaerolineales bacterium]|nr:hybrid sensor histidine kinase/response regulator [Anaerolineales bacterium]
MSTAESQSPPAATAPGDPPPGLAREPIRVLAVDDEIRNLEVLQLALTAPEFDLRVSDDSEVALGLAHDHQPHVILLDVVMPGLDGLALCRQIKADAQLGYVPIVLITGLRSSKDRLRGLEAGADEFISKPFEAVELMARVRALARTKRLYDELRAHNQDLEERVVARTAELSAAIRELQAGDRLKSEFIANVSHELRTPLLHVKGTVTLLRDGALGALTGEQTRGLAVAGDAVDQLERLVADIVDFGDTHADTVRPQALAVNRLCGAAARAAGSAAERRGSTIDLQIDPGLPEVWADEDAIVRALRHLLDNALKFGPPKVTVWLAATRTLGGVRFSVRDRGPGIPPDEQVRIFEPFYQIDGSETRAVGGMGLGLALVRRVLDAHHVGISVESTPGEGATFWFELPLAVDQM